MSNTINEIYAEDSLPIKEFVHGKGKEVEIQPYIPPFAFDSISKTPEPYLLIDTSKPSLSIESLAPADKLLLSSTAPVESTAITPTDNLQLSSITPPTQDATPARGWGSWFLGLFFSNSSSSTAVNDPITPLPGRPALDPAFKINQGDLDRLAQEMLQLLESLNRTKESFEDDFKDQNIDNLIFQVIRNTSTGVRNNLQEWMVIQNRQQMDFSKFNRELSLKVNTLYGDIADKEGLTKLLGWVDKGTYALMGVTALISAAIILAPFVAGAAAGTTVAQAVMFNSSIVAKGMGTIAGLANGGSGIASAILGHQARKAQGELSMLKVQKELASGKAEALVTDMRTVMNLVGEMEKGIAHSLKKELETSQNMIQ